MTIEDLLNAGITLQGFLSIIKFDDKTDQKTVVFEGEAEGRGYEKYQNKHWYTGMHPPYIYPDCAGYVIELA